MKACKPGSTPMRIALVQSGGAIADDFLAHLGKRNIVPSLVESPETILRRLSVSMRECDIVLYPIWTNWQHALNFGRGLRCLRETWGSPPYPRLLVLSFVEQLPVTVQWFMRTVGTRYMRFVSEENLVQALRSMRDEILAVQRGSQRLHLRFVHAGNPGGLGCIHGEKLVAAYASFQPGEEDQVEESDSVLRFLNLLGMYRWRSRSSPELVHIMRRNPLYVSEGLGTNVISVASAKTYVHRCESALASVWRRSVSDCQPPKLIARDHRGGREIAYRLLATCEIDHI
jgi:hypothetical protein